MPELPESDTNRARVEAGALNRTIARVEPGNDVSHITLPDAAERQRLIGRQFTQTRRHGKVIFAGSAEGPWMAVHLGMSGSLRPFDEGEAAPDHVKLLVSFEGARRLAFRCPRKLGWVRIVDDPDSFIEAQGYGPDAMKIDRADFAARIGGGRGALKAALMDQKKMAGVGNLWSDETLYQCDLMPDARIDRLPDDAMGRLHTAMRRILGKVLEVGADYDRLPKDWLIHRRREGETCPRCGGTIARMKVGGRSAFHCPDHQAGA